MAIEYLHDAIRASSGQDVRIAAKITDNEGAEITSACKLTLWNGNEIICETEGECVNGEWAFIIPESVTIELHGRYFYTISNNGEHLAFRQPIYLI